MTILDVPDDRTEARRIDLALMDIIAAARLEGEDQGAVSIEGKDPVLRTRYRIGAAGAASHVAVGLAASALHQIRGGPRQKITISVPAATASLRGDHYMTIDGKKPQRPWEDISGFYKVKGGRTILFHCNFPNLRDKAARVLGVNPVRTEVARACLEWDGATLETAIHDGGGCASYVRTPEEWEAHPHFLSVKALPLMEIVRIGDAPPEPLTRASRPLAGIRALDLTRVIAGPHCGRTLAEHGAEVLKVSRPDLADSGMLDLVLGIGKRSTYLDFRNTAQRERLSDLIRGADVFVQSYRPGALAAHGFGPEDLAEKRPGIVIATLSAWGHEGPWRKRRGYDTIVQSATGMACVSGGSKETPAFTPVSALDYICGNLLACGVMVALRRRALTGGSWMVRTSLASAQHWLTNLGLLPADSVNTLPTDVSDDVTSPYMRSVNAPAGIIKYLGPVLAMTDTPPGTDVPPVPLGTHSPEWLNT